MGRLRGGLHGRLQGTLFHPLLLFNWQEFEEFEAAAAIQSAFLARKSRNVFKTMLMKARAELARANDIVRTLRARLVAQQEADKQLIEGSAREVQRLQKVVDKLERRVPILEGQVGPGIEAHAAVEPDAILMRAGRASPLAMLAPTKAHKTCMTPPA